MALDNNEVGKHIKVSHSLVNETNDNWTQNTKNVRMVVKHVGTESDNTSGGLCPANSKGKYFTKFYIC